VSIGVVQRLTVKSRGRPEAPEQATRVHNLFRARGADMQAGHGPLQRLLDGAKVKYDHALLEMPSTSSR